MTHWVERIRSAWLWPDQQIAKLLDRWSWSITAVVGEDAVTFYGRDRTVRIRPFMYMRDNVVLSVGEPPLPQASLTEVDLRVPGPERVELLAKFIAYAFVQLTGRGVMMKPTLRLDVRDASARAYWADAARQAKVASVSFF